MTFSDDQFFMQLVTHQTHVFTTDDKKRDPRIAVLSEAARKRGDLYVYVIDGRRGNSFAISCEAISSALSYRVPDMRMWWEKVE